MCWVFLFLSIRKKLDWEYFELLSRNQSYWVETVSAIQDIKINNYEKHRRWKWEEIQARLYHVNKRVLAVTNAQNLGAQFIESIKNMAIVFFCAMAVIQGEITFGMMISTQFIIGMLNGPLVQFINFVVSAQYAKISFLRINEIRQLEDEEELMSIGNTTILPEKKTIRLENVHFQYTVNTPMVLRNIYLQIPENKVTAIVGGSGSGKSTLLKLLVRLYKPSYGEIKMDTMNVNAINLRQWRSLCGVVMQDGKVFSDTILNNIVLDDEHIDYNRLLLLTNAQNKCDTVFRSDSIQKLLVNYYESHGTANERMLAHYLLGRAYQDIHDYPNALNNYQKAANHADTTDIECDYALLSRVYGQMSDVFYHQNLIEEDLKFNNLAIRYSWKAKDTLAAILGMAGNIAAYKGMGKPDSALSICEQASVLARRYGYKNLSAGILGGAITILVEKDSLNKAKTFMDIYESESGFFDENHDIVKGREVYYYPKGRYYLAVGKYDSAEHYFRKELREGKDFNNQNAASRGLALLFQKTHRPDSAAKYALYSYTMNDSVYANMATEEVERMKAMYDYSRYQESARLANEKSEKMHKRLMVIGFSTFSIIAITFIVIRRERKKRIAALHHYKQSIAELAKAQSEVIRLRSHGRNIETALSQAQSNIEELNNYTSELNLLIEKKEIDIEILRSDIEKYQSKETKEREIAEAKLKDSEIYHIFDKLAAKGNLPSAEEWQQMYMMVIDFFPSFYQFISSKKYALNEKEFNTCILIRLHFRPKDICNLLGVSSAYITKIRNTMMKKLFGVEGNSKKLDEEILGL